MENTRFIRAAALWCAIGSLLSLGLGVAGAVSPDAMRSQSMVLPTHLILIVMNVLILAGTVGLAASGAATGSAVSRIGLGGALLGQALFIVAELAGIANAKSTDQLLYAIGTPLIALGMVAIGIVMLREKRWHGWHPWTPVMWGLYPAAVMLPIFALAGTRAQVSALVLGGWGLPPLLLALALWQEASARQAVQPGLAG